MAQRPLIADIKRGSVEDGPGIRTVVFFKGCPLRCVFCHNPETQSYFPEIMFSSQSCVLCGACSEVCPTQAIELGRPGRILRHLCNGCGKCVEVCPGQGLRIIGAFFTGEKLFHIILEDAAFYRHSGGGVTMSGGECTAFPQYLGKLLPDLKRRSIHVAIQTSGYFNYHSFSRMIAPHVDLVYFDVKIADDRTHRGFTRRPNWLIIDNLTRLIQDAQFEVHPRIPLVPGITDGEKNIVALTRMLRRAGARQVSLLPYNPMGLDKYEALGRATPELPARFMNPQEMDRVCQMVSAQSGLAANVEPDCRGTTGVL